MRPYLIVATAVLATLACKPRQPSGNTAPPTIMPAVANKFEPKEGSMFLGKPLMSLRLDLESCPYKVFVNGGLVSMHIADAPANEEHPINHFLRFGDNVIELWVAGVAEEEWPAIRANVTLEVSESDAVEPRPTTVMKMAFKGGVKGPTALEGSSPEGLFDSARLMTASSIGDVRVGPVELTKLPEIHHGVRIRRTVSLPLRLPPWRFLTSERMLQPHELSDDQSNKFHDELFAAYQVIWDALAKKDLKSILPLFQERSQETDAALYRTPGTTQERLTEMLTESIESPDMQLAPLPSPHGRWIVDVGSEGNLAALLFNYKASPIIRFKRAEKGFRRIFPIWWRREGGRFIIAR